MLMTLRKIFLFTLVSCFLLVTQTGCEEDRPQRVEGAEETTSPAHLGEWMEQLTAIIRSTNLRGPQASRILAYASIAYYQGYSMSSDEMRSLVGQLQGLDELPEPDPELVYNYGVIAEAAMHRTLANHFEDAPINIKLVLSSTYSSHERDYSVLGVSDAVIERSREFGWLLGDAINIWSDSDGYDEVIQCSKTLPIGPQYWKPTLTSFSGPELACWGDIRPFTFNSDELITLCHPGLPEDFSTTPQSQYENDLIELIDYKVNMNAEQEAIAKFWNDGNGSFTVPGHYVSILAQLVDQNLLDGKETVTAWAQLCIAMADTYVSTYKLKYTYFTVRPITVIRANNDADWESYLLNPATPEFPSLRATMAYSATQVLINLYGDIEFRDNSQSIFNLGERHYPSFTEMGREAAYSRLYAGTNLRSTLDRSEYHGRCIAQRANELFLNQ